MRGRSRFEPPTFRTTSKHLIHWAKLNADDTGRWKAIPNRATQAGSVGKSWQRPWTPMGLRRQPYCSCPSLLTLIRFLSWSLLQTIMALPWGHLEAAVLLSGGDLNWQPRSFARSGISRWPKGNVSLLLLKCSLDIPLMPRYNVIFWEITLNARNLGWQQGRKNSDAFWAHSTHLLYIKPPWVNDVNSQWCQISKPLYRT